MDSEKELTTVLSAAIVKRSVVVAGHSTSVSIEQPFWNALRDIAKAQGKSLNKIITEIDASRPKTIEGVNLCSAIRLYVLHASNT